jgi:hypothetical protein
MGQTPGAVTTVGNATTTTASISSTTTIASDGSGQISTTVGYVSQPSHGSSSSSSSTAASTTVSSATSSLPPPAPSGTGAYGYVTAGPTCPVERPDQPCPPRPVIAEVDARDTAGTLVAKGQSDAAGRYSLSLPAGSYTLTISTGMAFPRCPAVHVTVGVGARTRADVSCDTGIR